jgi:sulfonate transport system substrate-binding protein
MYHQNERHITIVFIIGIMACLIFNGCQEKQSEPSRELTKITVGTVPAIVEASVHVAYEKGYFKDEGLDAELIMNPDGKTSLQMLFDGKADIVNVMGTPVVYASFDRNDFYIIGKIRHSKIHFAVARKDRGIHKTSGLKGKRVAVTKGTSAEFFMDSYLIYNGITPSELEIVYMDAPTMVDAIQKGEVDAMFCWSPFPFLAQKLLGENAVILPSETIVPGSWLVVVKKDFAREHPDILIKYLKGIVSAEQFIADNKEEAISIHARLAGVDKGIVSELFKNIKLDLCLDQALLNDLEDQGR